MIPLQTSFWTSAIPWFGTSMDPFLLRVASFVVHVPGPPSLCPSYKLLRPLRSHFTRALFQSSLYALPSATRLTRDILVIFRNWKWDSLFPSIVSYNSTLLRTILSKLSEWDRRDSFCLTFFRPHLHTSTQSSNHDIKLFFPKVEETPPSSLPPPFPRPRPTFFFQSVSRSFSTVGVQSHWSVINPPYRKGRSVGCNL